VDSLVGDLDFVLLGGSLEDEGDSHRNPRDVEGSHHIPPAGEAVPVLCNWGAPDSPNQGKDELLDQEVLLDHLGLLVLLELLELLDLVLLLLHNCLGIFDSDLAGGSSRLVLAPLLWWALHTGYLVGGQGVGSQRQGDLWEDTAVHTQGSTPGIGPGVLLAPCILVLR